MAGTVQLLNTCIAVYTNSTKMTGTGVWITLGGSKEHLKDGHLENLRLNTY